MMSESLTCAAVRQGITTFEYLFCKKKDKKTPYSTLE